jgi:hypothetical protein
MLQTGMRNAGREKKRGRNRLKTTLKFIVTLLFICERTLIKKLKILTRNSQEVIKENYEKKIYR